jgi:hypothetical protein
MKIFKKIKTLKNGFSNGFSKTKNFLVRKKASLFSNSKFVKSTINLVEQHYFYVPFLCSLPSAVLGASPTKYNQYNDDLFLDITKLTIVSSLVVEGSYRLNWIKSNVRHPTFVGIELASLGMLAANYKQFNIMQRSLIITNASLCISASTLQIVNKYLGYVPTVGKYLEYPLNITSSALWGCYGIAGHLNSYTNKLCGWKRGYADMDSTASLLPPVPVPYNFIPPSPIINGTDIGFNMNFWN